MPDPYAIEPEPAGPDLPGRTELHRDEDAVLDALAADIYVHALDCARRFGDFHLAIAAGRFQQRLCVRLMTDPAVRLLPWNRTHLWASRAHRVESNDGHEGGTSDFREIVDLLADHAGLPEGNVHEPAFSGEDHAAAYERELQQSLAWREKGHDRLDLVVLALSPAGTIDGFAADETTDAPDPRNRLITPNNAPAGTEGIAMTPMLVNSARMIAVAATGADLAPVLRDTHRGAARPGDTIRPIGGVLCWYIDRHAFPG